MAVIPPLRICKYWYSTHYQCKFTIVNPAIEPRVFNLARGHLTSELLSRHPTTLMPNFNQSIILLDPHPLPAVVNCLVYDTNWTPLTTVSILRLVTSKYMTETLCGL